MVGWILIGGALFLALRKKVVQAQAGPVLPVAPPSELPLVGAAVAQPSPGLLTMRQSTDFGATTNARYIPSISGLMPGGVGYAGAFFDFPGAAVGSPYVSNTVQKGIVNFVRPGCSTNLWDMKPLCE